MSNLLSTKAPAHAGLRAQPAELGPVSADTTARLAGLCGASEAEVRRLGSRLPAPSGFYRVEATPEPLFVKVSSEAEAARQIAADRFARHAAACGVPASTLLAGYPKRFDAQHFVLGYRWIEGRYARSDAADAAAVGRVLARVHQALASCPQQEEIRRATERRLARLCAQAGGPLDADWLGPAQPTHGDFNHGNLLFPSAGGQPVVLDYEDAAISWFPPALDVAFALERFALAGDGDDEQARRLGEALFGSYAAQSGRRELFPRQGALRQALRLLSSRALAQLRIAPPSGEGVVEAERRKFESLLEQAERRASLLAALEAPYVRSAA